MSAIGTVSRTQSGSRTDSKSADVTMNTRKIETANTI